MFMLATGSSTTGYSSLCISLGTMGSVLSPTNMAVQVTYI